MQVVVFYHPLQKRHQFFSVRNGSETFWWKFHFSDFSCFARVACGSNSWIESSISTRSIHLCPFLLNFLELNRIIFYFCLFNDGCTFLLTVSTFASLPLSYSLRLSLIFVRFFLKRNYRFRLSEIVIINDLCNLVSRKTMR